MLLGWDYYIIIIIIGADNELSSVGSLCFSFFPWYGMHVCMVPFGMQELDGAPLAGLQEGIKAWQD
jgi:hypothetical protein